jgi:glycosyltransferase involved in cell wall biosynthesis
VTLLYTGTIVEIPDAARALWQGLRRMRERRPDAARLEILVVGAVLADVARDAQELGVADLVRFEPSVDRIRALALQRRADALLVLARDDRPTVLTNKLVEYLVAGPPVMVVGAQSEAGRLVRERDAGAVLSSEDPDGIADALGRLLDGTLPRAEPSGLDDLSAPASARRLAELLEGVLARG